MYKLSSILFYFTTFLINWLKSRPSMTNYLCLLIKSYVAEKSAHIFQSGIESMCAQCAQKARFFIL